MLASVPRILSEVVESHILDMQLRILATFIVFISASVDVTSLSTNPLPTTGVFSLNVALYVKEERREEFIKCIQANQEGTLTAEPLALQYDWFVHPKSLKSAKSHS